MFLYSGENKSRVCFYIVVRTRVEYVFIYSKTENATLCSLPWTQVANFFFSKSAIFVATYPKQLSRLPGTVSILKASASREVYPGFNS